MEEKYLPSDNEQAYDTEKLKYLDDYRFNEAKKEGILVQGVCIVSLLLIIYIAYHFCPKDISEMTYLVGFPLWVIAAGAVALITFLVVIIYCKYFSKVISLAAKDEEGGAQS